MIKNMKLGKILMLAFLTVTLISSLTGIFGLFLMVNMSVHYNTALQDYGFAQGDVGRLNAEFNNSSSLMRDIILYTKEEDIKNSKEQLDKSIANMDTDLKAVEKTISTDKEKGYYKTIADSMSAYKALRNRVVTLAERNNDEDAQSMLVSEGTGVVQKMGTAIDQLLKSKTSSGGEISSSLSRQTTFAAIAIAAVIVAALLLSVGIAVKISRDISKPVKEMSDAAKRMAEGDLNVEIGFQSKNEIGELGEAFATSAATIRGYISDIGKILGEMERGNLDVHTDMSYIGDYAELKNSLTGIIEFLNDTMTQINQAAEQVASGSEQVSGGAQSLAQGATEQASSIQQLSASITEISSQVTTNAANAMNANENVGIVRTEINTSNGHMKEMLEAMTQINNSSSEIGKIIKVIEDIAFQTNILALNAAVEAARAGAAGKGFAVVADEVRNLASKSAQAAQNTTALIENSLRQVESGTKIADETAKALLRVVESTDNVSETVNLIATASAAQSDAIAQVTLGVDQISNVVQTNSATAEESAAASEELSGQAQTLKELVAKFSLRGQNSPLDPESTGPAETKSDICITDFE